MGTEELVLISLPVRFDEFVRNPSRIVFTVDIVCISNNIEDIRINENDENMNSRYYEYK